MQNPSVMTDPLVNAIASQLDGLTGESRSQATQLITQHAPAPSAPEGPGLTVMRQAQPRAVANEQANSPESDAPALDDTRRCVYWDEARDGVVTAVSEKLSQINVWNIVKQALYDWFMPLPGVWQDLTEMAQALMHKGTQIAAIASFQDIAATLNRVLDLGLIIWRYVNSIAGRLYGWFFMFCVIMGGAAGAGAGGIIGTIGGAIAGLGVGAVPGAAAGGLAGFAAGAGAGAAFAGTVGLYLAGSFIAESLVSIGKSVYDLFKSPQTDEERIEDYDQIANSGIGLAVMALLVAFAAIASKIASAIWNAVKLKLPTPFQ